MLLWTYCTWDQTDLNFKYGQEFFFAISNHPYQEVAGMAKGKRLIKMASCVFCPDNLQSQSTRRATLHYKSLQYSLHKYDTLLNDAVQNYSL